MPCGTAGKIAPITAPARHPAGGIAGRERCASTGESPTNGGIPCHDHWRQRPTGEDAAMKKAIGWILLILLIFYIGTQPGPAADIAHNLGSGIANIFRNIGVFFSNLATK
jgi:hypothetical protein